MSENILIQNGTILDGTGQKRYQADVRIAHSAISKIGRGIVPNGKEEHVIDARNRCVCPGFFDIHNHSDFYLLDEDHGALLKPLCYQGITTLVGGNCGFSAFPIERDQIEQFVNSCKFLMHGSPDISWSSCAEYLSVLESRGTLFNFLTLTGHGVLRGALAPNARRLSAKQIDEIDGKVVESLEQGSYGLSTGLMYSPGCFSDTEEIIHFARLLSRYPHALYSSHMRGYSETLVESVEEFLSTVSSAGVAGEISHFASYGAKNAPKIENALRKIMECNRGGARVQYDVLPYCSGSTTLMAIIPPWEYEKGIDDFIRGIKNDEHLERMMDEMNHFVPKWPTWENRYWSDNFVRNCGWQGIYVVGLEHNTDLIGLNFIEIAERKKTSISHCLRDLLIEENCNILTLMTDDIGGCIGDHLIYLDMMLENPLSNICTDALFQQNGRSMAPTYGAFPRFIRRYVNEKKVFTLEEAIHKMTKKVADLFGITDRGTLKKGKQADILIFNENELKDHPLCGSQYYTRDPDLATGIDYLLINGEIVIEKNNYYGSKRPGRILRRNSG